MWAIIVILIFVGLLLLILEILVIPGTGLVGIVGFVAMVAGVWLAYSRKGIASGNIALLFTILLNVAAIVLSLRSKTWKNAQLKSSISGKTGNKSTLGLKSGDRGKTVSRCVPMGKVEFNGSYYEANAGTQFIDPGKPVKITKISESKIFIKQINS